MDIALVNQSSRIASNDKVLTVFKNIGNKYLTLVAEAWDRADNWCVSLNDTNPSAIPASFDAICILQDYPRDPGAAGDHNEIDGRPILEVFLGAILDNGGDLLRGADSAMEAYTHELGETFGNATINRWRMRADTSLVPEELCDGVQGSPFDLAADDGTVCSCSNFALPPYFDIYGSGKFDYQGLIQHPFGRLETGYNNVITPGNLTQEFGAEMKPWMVMLKSRPTSRLGRIAQRYQMQHTVKHVGHVWWHTTKDGEHPTSPPYPPLVAPVR